MEGRLVIDDFSGYKACFELGVTEVGCMAHARRKFHELWVNHGRTIAEQALSFYGALYDLEREVLDLDADARRELRQRRAGPVADALQQWLLAQRQKVPDGSATAKGIDYTLNRWVALTRYLTMVSCRSTTTGSRTRSGHSRLGARTGCLPEACERASALRP